MYNWHTLNNKLFKKLGYTTTLEIMTCIVHMRPGYVEYLLWDLKQKVPNFLTKVEQYLGISTDSKSGRSRTVSGDKKNKSAATRRRIQIDDHQSKSPQSNRSKKASETSQSKFEMDDRSHFDPAGDHKPHNPEEYEETIKIMALKMQRMEELLKLKDGKIQELSYS